MASHTVVVGGGVIGVATAYYLAQREQNVTLVEQNELCSGCSQGNAGQITPGHLPLPQPEVLRRSLHFLLSSTSPLYIRPRVDVELFGWLWRFSRACTAQHLHKSTKILGDLGRASIQLFERLSSSLNFSYRNEGRLEVCRTPKTLHAVQREAALLQILGFESRVLTGPELHAFEPAVTENVAGAVYYPLSAHCNPQRFVMELAGAATALGVEFRPHTRVTEVSSHNGHSVHVATDRQEIRADAVVLACGSWAPHLVRRLGLRLPVQPGKGYHLDIDRPDPCPKMPLTLVDERIFVTPVDDVLRFAGTLEFSGFDLKENPARIEMLRLGASRYLSGIDQARPRSQWCHVRPMTPDGLPIIGRAPSARNVWIAAGHGMLGLTQGPITGSLIAEWVTDGRPSIDLSALRPDRF